MLEILLLRGHPGDVRGLSVDSIQVCERVLHAVALICLNLSLIYNNNNENELENVMNKKIKSNLKTKFSVG